MRNGPSRHVKWKLLGTAAAVALPALLLWGNHQATAQAVPPPAECVTQKGDLVGCQPTPFNVPLALIPTRRIDQNGNLNPMATEEQVRAGAKLVERQLGLFRNFEHIHWVPYNASTRAADGRWGGGDLDGEGDGRALTIAGKCAFLGHANGGGGERPLEIMRIADNPLTTAPRKVGEIPVPVKGADDSIMSARLFTKANGTETIMLMRDISTDDGGLWTYEINPANCAVIKTAKGFEHGGDLHEMGMWIDPKNPMRTLVVTAASGGAGRPDPNRPGMLTPDIRVHAVTDERTGELLATPTTLAHYTLQDVGGPVAAERPDATGLYRDGRYPDYTGVINYNGQPIALPTAQNNRSHQVTFAADGKRVYVAHGLAGFYVLNTEAIAANTDAALVAKTAGCNWESTNIYRGGVIGAEIDPAKLPVVARDCLHMVINDDPGVKALATAGNVTAWLRMQDRSRFDPFPQALNSTGMHSAIPVPNRPSLDKSNVDGQRPAYVVLSTERGGCPTSLNYIVSIEVEAFPVPVATFGVAQNELSDCVRTPTVEANGDPRRALNWQAHNPTVFKNLIVMSWYGHGIRAIDISNIYNPREVGHAVPAPAGVARSYPVFDKGLVYWVDNDTGLHVARYHGPWANEIPADMVVGGNDVLHK